MKYFESSYSNKDNKYISLKLEYAGKSVYDKNMEERINKFIGYKNNFEYDDNKLREIRNIATYVQYSSTEKDKRYLKIGNLKVYYTAGFHYSSYQFHVTFRHKTRDLSIYEEELYKFYCDLNDKVSKEYENFKIEFQKLIKQ